MRAGTVILYLGLGAAYAYLGWNEPYSWWVVSGFLLLHVGHDTTPGSFSTSLRWTVTT